LAGLVADLRTRIAAVVADTMNGTPPERWDFLLADRIIAELGLRLDTVGLIHRYVTDWEAEK
jgi:hypothetical protein